MMRVERIELSVCLRIELSVCLRIELSVCRRRAGLREGWTVACKSVFTCCAVPQRLDRVSIHFILVSS